MCILVIGIPFDEISPYIDNKKHSAFGQGTNFWGYRQSKNLDGLGLTLYKRSNDKIVGLKIVEFESNSIIKSTDSQPILLETEKRFRHILESLGYLDKHKKVNIYIVTESE